MPLAIGVSDGAANERRYLFRLIDELIAAGLRPEQVWADRGYDGAPQRDGLAERRIVPVISERRKRGEAIPPGTPKTTRTRGNRRIERARDPNGRHRWVVERTNAWLHNLRRLDTRRDVKIANYQAFLTLGLIIILHRNIRVHFQALSGGSWALHDDGTLQVGSLHRDARVCERRERCRCRMAEQGCTRRDGALSELMGVLEKFAEGEVAQEVTGEERGSPSGGPPFTSGVWISSLNTWSSKCRWMML